MRKVDHDSRREEVAAAAARLIAEQGLEALTTRALAKQLGCSIGVLSHYFNSKEDIVIAAFNWADQRIDQRIQEAMSNRKPSINAFLPLITAGLPLDEESDMEWRVRINLNTYALTHSASLKAQNEKLEHFRELMMALMVNLQEQGELRSDVDPAMVTNLAFDITNGAAMNLLRIPLPERQAYADHLISLVEQLRPAAQRKPVAVSDL